MEENSLISIIIPAYNAEKYIKNCIESVRKQTYKTIEIIIVDDGSTDKTCEFLDEYSSLDSRIVIIHKKNEGVSIARNTGLEKARGKYVIFVDADDYLANDYVSYMLEIAETTSADFCLSKNCFTKIGEKQVENDKIEQLQPEEATALLLSPSVIVGCWNKMFRREFLIEKELRFSSTLFYGEGLSFITMAAQLSNCIGIGNRKVYYYRRNNEASATTKFNIEKIRNGERALYHIKKALTINDNKINTMWNLHMCIYALGAVVRIKTNHKDKEYKEDYNYWKRYLRSHVGNLILKNNISLYRKAMLLAGCISPTIMAKLDQIRRSRIANRSVK